VQPAINRFFNNLTRFNIYFTFTDRKILKYLQPVLIEPPVVIFETYGSDKGDIKFIREAGLQAFKTFGPMPLISPMVTEYAFS
jgi:hypothetical protein